MTRNRIAAAAIALAALIGAGAGAARANGADSGDRAAPDQVADQVADPIPAPADDSCGAAALADHLGAPAADLGTALPAGARLLPPGSMMTQDFRPDRVNLDLDAEGRITRIWCG